MKSESASEPAADRKIAQDRGKSFTGESNAFRSNVTTTAGRTDAEAAIEEVRQRGGVFVNAVRATRMPMALTDPNLPGNPIVFANDAFLKLSGYTMDEVLGQQPYFMNGPGTDPRDEARFMEILSGGQDEIIETVQYRKDGSRFIATVLLSAFKDDEGRTLNHFLSWLDVTRRVRAEDDLADLRKLQAALQESEARYRESNSRLRTLLAELQHRVRNTLAVVKSITIRTAESSSSVDEMAAHLSGRLEAFARVQSAVTRNPDAGIELSSMVADEMLAHAAHEGDGLSIDGPYVALRPKAAESMSLALHELATNAVKHGALAGRNGGNIAIKWKLNGKRGNGHLDFEWVEHSGNGAIARPARHGFGMELLTRILPYDLGAKTKVEFMESGLRFAMALPAEHLASTES